jgi:hypothetical protein
MWRLLPALIPSWRFFDTIGPSPRLEYRWLAGATTPLSQWQPFRPRPMVLSAAQQLLRLVWNPAWNETLYVMRCAERVLEGDVGFPLLELERRMRGELCVAAEKPVTAVMFEMQILAASAEGPRITYQAVYHSPPLTLAEVRPR